MDNNQQNKTIISESILIQISKWEGHTLTEGFQLIKEKELENYHLAKNRHAKINNGQKN